MKTTEAASRPDLRSSTSIALESISSALENRKTIIPIQELQGMANRAFTGMRSDSETLRRNATNLCKVISNTIAMPTRIDISPEDRDKAIDELAQLDRTEQRTNAASIVDELIEPSRKLLAHRRPNLEFCRRANNGGTFIENGTEYNLREKNIYEPVSKNDGIRIVRDKEGKLTSLNYYLGTNIINATPECLRSYSLKKIKRNGALEKIIQQRLSLIDEHLNLSRVSGAEPYVYKRAA